MGLASLLRKGGGKEKSVFFGASPTFTHTHTHTHTHKHTKTHTNKKTYRETLHIQERSGSGCGASQRCNPEGSWPNMCTNIYTCRNKVHNTADVLQGDATDDPRA